MALYSLWVVAAEKRSRRWTHSRTKRPRHVETGVAGMMIDTARRLSRILGKRVDSQLEGGGLLLEPAQLRGFLRSASTPNERLVDWACKLNDKERFFLFAEEE